MPDTTDTTLEKPASSTPAAATDAAPVDSSAAEPAKAAPLATDTAQVSQEPAKTEAEVKDAVPDWVTAAARGDEKRREKLMRHTDPGAIFDALEETQKKLHESGKVKIPTEKSTPEEIAAFNKQVGVPEKPEDYKITPKLPEGFEFNELDKGVVAGITKELHARGGILAHPQVIQAAVEVFAKSSEEAQAQLIARATELHNETQAALDKEWGPEKGRNLGFAKGMIERFTSGEPEEVRDLLQTPLMAGGKLGDHPVFIRMMAKIGREFGDDPLLTELGGTSDTVSTLEAEKAAILKLRADGKFAEYDAKAQRLTQINDALARQARKK